MYYDRVTGVFKSIDGTGFLTVIRVSATPINDAILPPFTGRTTKSILLKSSCLSHVARLYESRGAFRPVAVTVLRRGNERLVKYCNGDITPITVKAGERLYFYVKFYSPEPVHIAPCDEIVDVGYAKFNITFDKIVVYDITSLGSRNWNTVTLYFNTPTLLTNKIMIPPVESKLIERLRRLPESYKILPTPSYIFAAAVRQWIAILNNDKPDMLTLPYRVGRIMDIVLREIHYNVKPVTACYGKDDNGRMKRVKGFTGRITLEPLVDELKPLIQKLAVFSAVMNLGKSRSIGFGEVAYSFK